MITEELECIKRESRSNFGRFSCVITTIFKRLHKLETQNKIVEVLDKIKYIQEKYCLMLKY